MAYRAKKNSRAFSLLEVMTVLGVTAIALTAAVPSVSDTIKRTNMLRDMTLLSLQAREAREVALRTGSSVQFAVDNDLKTVTMKRMSLDCKVLLDPSAPPIKSTKLSKDSNVTTLNWCINQATGTPDNGLGVASAKTILVKDKEGNILGQTIMTPAGLVVTKVGAESIPGLVNEVSSAQTGQGTSEAANGH